MVANLMALALKKENIVENKENACYLAFSPFPRIQKTSHRVVELQNCFGYSNYFHKSLPLKLRWIFTTLSYPKNCP